MDRIRALLLAAPVLLVCPLDAAAADARLPSIETLLQTEIEGASRFAQPLADAPSSVSVISASDIRAHGFRTLGEALQTVRGVYTSYERDYSYIGVRGFARPGDYNTRVLMMTDGIRRNDPLYDTAMIGREAPIEMDWVRQIEFVPGPASALYGANAMFGVANAVLWSGGDIDGHRVTAEAGSGNMTRLGYLAGRRLAGGGDWLFGLSAYGRQGDDLYFANFDAPGVGNGIAHKRDGERTIKAIAKFSTGGWRVDAGFATRYKNVPTAYYGTVFDAPGTYLNDQSAYADLAHAHEISPALTGKLGLRAGSYRYDGQYVYAPALNQDKANADWFGIDYTLGYSGIAGHRILAGIELQRNSRLEQRNFDTQPGFVYFDDRREGDSAGIFVQDEWRIGQRWLVNLGARADRVAGFSAVSPRAALIHHPLPEATLKLIYGRAFRAPNTYERYYNDGNVLQKANPDLRPERNTTYELAADYALTRALRVSGSVYHYRIDRLIDQVVDPADGVQIFVNRPALNARGVELEAELLLGGGMRLKGSVARQTVNQPFGDAINSPRLMGKLLVESPLFSDAWTLGVNLQAMDRRRSPVGEVAGHVVGNIVVRRKNAGSMGSLSLAIYNVGATTYFDPAATAVAAGAVEQDDRQVRLVWELPY